MSSSIGTSSHTRETSSSTSNHDTIPTTSTTDTAPQEVSHRISAADTKLYHEIVDLSHDYPYILEAVNRIADSISRYKLQHCALSFNGGKDCTVLLHLLRASLAKLHLHISDMSIIYFKVDNEFHEIEEFMSQCCESYHLQLTRVEGNFCDALQLIFAERKSGHLPCIDAILMGQRRDDPYCNDLAIESASDEEQGWPSFHRINVLLDWTYQEIWTFLRVFNLPYCKLYDQGYTSIGNTLDSIPNPTLYHAESKSYKAAYELLDDSKERCGRKEKDRTPRVGVPHHNTTNGVKANGLNT